VTRTIDCNQSVHVRAAAPDLREAHDAVVWARAAILWGRPRDEVLERLAPVVGYTVARATIRRALDERNSEFRRRGFRNLRWSGFFGLLPFAVYFLLDALGTHVHGNLAFFGGWFYPGILIGCGLLAVFFAIRGGFRIVIGGRGDGSVTATA